MATQLRQQAVDSTQPLVQVTEMDHIVLRVRDIDTSLAFYHKVLGLPTERLQAFKAGKVPFPSIRINADTIIDLFEVKNMPSIDQTFRNQDHYCIVINPTDLSRLSEHLQEIGVELAPVSPSTPDQVGGPVTRWGAHGNGTSLYIYDPDGNVVELRYY